MKLYERSRLQLISEWIEKYDIKSVLDLGSRGILKKIIDVDSYDSIDVKGTPDIVLDLNEAQKLPFPPDSYDCVVLSQILEHLFYPQKILKESIRVSRKFIIIGLPHDFSLDLRMKALLGRNWRPIYRPYEHKGLLHRNEYKKFIKPEENGLTEIEKHYLFGLRGDRFLPKWLKGGLAKWNLFCRNFYIIYQKTKSIKKEWNT